MKNILFILFISPCFIFGQVISPSLISNSGGSFTSPTLNMDYSIGEIVVETFQNNEILTQGFQQDGIKITTLITGLGITTKVFPNPTTNLLFIELESKVDGTILVYDIKGKLLVRDNLQNENNKQIDFSSFSQGNYLLHIKVLDKTSIYKIEKFK